MTSISKKQWNEKTRKHQIENQPLLDSGSQANIMNIAT